MQGPSQSQAQKAVAPKQDQNAHMKRFFSRLLGRVPRRNTTDRLTILTQSLRFGHPRLVSVFLGTVRSEDELFLPIVSMGMLVVTPMAFLRDDDESLMFAGPPPFKTGLRCHFDGLACRHPFACWMRRWSFSRFRRVERFDTGDSRFSPERQLRSSGCPEPGIQQHYSYERRYQCADRFGGFGLGAGFCDDWIVPAIGDSARQEFLFRGSVCSASGRKLRRELDCHK
jgi:hypothetical protein